MTAATERVPETTLIQFEIKDQFDRPHSERELQDRNVLLLCGDRKGSQYQGQWAAAFATRFARAGALKAPP
jgi:hypothetical protein